MLRLYYRKYVKKIAIFTQNLQIYHRYYLKTGFVKERLHAVTIKNALPLI